MSWRPKGHWPDLAEAMAWAFLAGACGAAAPLAPTFLLGVLILLGFFLGILLGGQALARWIDGE